MKRSKQCTRAVVLAGFMIAHLAAWPDAHAQSGTTEIIAVAGGAAPDGNGDFSFFFNPALNDGGRAMFPAFLTNTAGGSADDAGIFKGRSQFPLKQIVRKGDAAPDGNGTIAVFDSAAITRSGLVTFLAFFDDTTGGSADDSGIYRSDGNALTQIFREGGAAPDNNGVFSSFSNPSPNAAGLAAARILLNNTAGGSADDSGIYRGDGTTQTQIAREGDAAPDGNGTLSSFGFPAMNDSGVTAFRVVLDGTAGGVTDNRAIVRGDGGVLTQIVRTGQSAPDGNGSFSNLSPAVPLNNAGIVTFTADLTGTAGGAADDEGLFCGDGQAPLMQIARAGEAAPDGNGSFLSFDVPALNNAGEIGFRADLIDTSGGSADNEGLYIYGSTGVLQIARAGQAAPDGNGDFSSFDNLALNDAGQAAFLADFTGTAGGSADNKGLFYYDEHGVFQIARKGEAMLGSTVTDLGFTGSTGANGDTRSGLNGLGQLSYRFTLADGNSGIALWALSSGLLGDYNNSGLVEQGDLDLVLLNWGQLYDSITANWINQRPTEGIVDQSELDGVLLNWGDANVPDFTGATVPEPASSAVLGLGGLALSLFRWHRGYGVAR